MSRTRNTVMMVTELAAAGVTLYLAFRVVAGSDGSHVLHMKVCKAAENACQSQAMLWAHLADQCSKAYDRSRTVTA